MIARVALMVLIGVLAMTGAIAILVKAPTQSGFAISGVIASSSGSVPVGVPGTHVASGPNISEYLVHVAKTQPLVAASQQGFHSTHQRQQTFYFPSGWIHNTKKGSGDTSGGLGAATWYVPPTAVHYAFSGADNTIYYDPAIFKHASAPGPDFTKLIPIDWKHASKGTSEYTKYAAPGTWLHIQAGPNATAKWPEPVHLVGGPQNSHLGQGPGTIHQAEGSNKTLYLIVSDVHITTGDNSSTWVDPAHHQSSGWWWNQTSYIPSGPLPPLPPSPPKPGSSS